MAELITIKQPIERRTYIKGRFNGKFIGHLDSMKSDILHENFYDLEVLSGEIYTSKDRFHIRHWESGEPEEFMPVEKFLTKLPEALKLVVNYGKGENKYYEIKLHEPKLSGYILDAQLYEKDNVFGDISGEISGYILHYDHQEIVIEVENTIAGEMVGAIEPALFKTDSRTGRTETNGNYVRWEYFYSNGSTFWGAWLKQSGKDRFSFLGMLGGVLQIAFLALLLVPIVLNAWYTFLPFVVFWGIIYLLSKLPMLLTFIWRWFLRACLFVFVFSFLYGVILIFSNPVNSSARKIYDTDSAEEISEIQIEADSSDSIISHLRIWRDYNSKEYSGRLNVLVSACRASNINRNTFNLASQSTDQYNDLVSAIHDFDRSRLNIIYEMFDSLRTTNNLDNMHFAEVIVSCIQDIPYTLVLENGCEPDLYNDQFIRDYLNKNGKCEGGIKYGIFSPTEFMGNLIGDCDTRTLLLFTVLNHFKFDVAMLGSELYRHSVIGINLPYHGLAKIIDGKRYVIWETTQQGLSPGILPRELSDTRYWNVNLISNNQKPI